MVRQLKSLKTRGNGGRKYGRKDKGTGEQERKECKKRKEGMEERMGGKKEEVKEKGKNEMNTRRKKELK